MCLARPKAVSRASRACLGWAKKPPAQAAALVVVLNLYRNLDTLSGLCQLDVLEMDCNTGDLFRKQPSIDQRPRVLVSF